MKRKLKSNFPSPTSFAPKTIAHGLSAQVPQVQLVNATFVSAVAHSHRSPSTSSNKIKLDCKVTGYPTPWIQWFRNGELLRNGKSNYSIKMSKRRYNVQMSRLELELNSGRNETGIYECRAMSVIAREPSVGTYTLLVLPSAHYALIPMQPVDNGELQHQRAQQPAKQAGSQQDQPANQISGTPATMLPASYTTTPTTTTTTTTTSTTTTSTSTTPAPSTTALPATNSIKEAPATSARPAATNGGPSSDQSQPAGKPCPLDAHDNFCLNRGTCVHIEHIKEYYCR